jgi:hypothetical protein
MLILCILFPPKDQHFEATTTSDGAAVFPDVANARAVPFEVRVCAIEAGPFKINPSHKDFYFEINGDANGGGVHNGTWRLPKRFCGGLRSRKPGTMN